MQETSKKNVLKAIAAQDLLQEVNATPFNYIEFMIYFKLLSPNTPVMFVRLGKMYNPQSDTGCKLFPTPMIEKLK